MRSTGLAGVLRARPVEDSRPPGTRGSVGISKGASMQPYSKEFHGEVLAACDRGRSTREGATSFDVSESWIRRVKQEPDVAERREERKRAQPLLHGDRLVFVDEAWATTNMTRPRGRAQPLYPGGVPHLFHALRLPIHRDRMRSSDRSAAPDRDVFGERVCRRARSQR